MPCTPWPRAVTPLGGSKRRRRNTLHSAGPDANAVVAPASSPEDTLRCEDHSKRPQHIGPHDNPEAPTCRDLSNLYVARETLRCARAGCVPCCYKIVLRAGPGAQPNVRPELCLRIVAGGHHGNERIGLYRRSQRLLMVGDGDFSFSLALARGFATPSRLVATSHETLSSLRRIYPKVDGTLRELSSLGVVVAHGVDAARLPATLSRAGVQAAREGAGEAGGFDRIVWNFPCASRDEHGAALPAATAGADARSSAEIEANRALVNYFIRGASSLLRPGGEVHLTHKSTLRQWRIEQAFGGSAAGHGGRRVARFVGCVVFDRSCYPAYTPRKAFGNRSFPVGDAQTFVFSDEPGAPDATLPRAERRGAPPPHDSGSPVAQLDEGIIVELRRRLLLAPRSAPGSASGRGREAS